MVKWRKLVDFFLTDAFTMVFYLRLLRVQKNKEMILILNWNLQQRAHF